MTTKFVLSINGGGIRGIAAAQFLKKLEDNIDEPLYKKFDMYAGTSTGSLIAAAIAYEKMSGKQLVDLYSYKNANKIMDKSIVDDIFGIFQCVPEYKSTGLKEIVDELVGSKRMKDTEKDVIITAFDVSKFEPVVFKSFQNKKNILLSEALCMSSAAPGYFSPVYSKEFDMWGIDGGMFANNPSDVAYASALKLYGKDSNIKILSIGTGHKKRDSNFGEESENYGGIEWLQHGLVDIIFQAPILSTEYKMKTFTEALGHGYIHIDGEIENTEMDDVSEENIEKLKAIGDEWWELSKKDVLEMLSNNNVKE
jgi:patatin-like phospholipase/acyl hydrolase